MGCLRHLFNKYILSSAAALMPITNHCGVTH